MSMCATTHPGISGEQFEERQMQEAVPMDAAIRVLMKWSAGVVMC